MTLIAQRYLLQDTLGSGGMGAVYRALDRLSGQTVALKQVAAPTQHASTPRRNDSVTMRLSLAQEFKILASLRHPHIISVLDYGFHPDENGKPSPFFTMELLEQPRPFSAANDWTIPLKGRLIAQLLQALAYLHRRGILHRDLKPNNVLIISDEDGDPQVKTLDFGLSIPREKRDDVAGAAGTIGYIAPEVLMGQSASEAADLYAAGVMAFELFAGIHPFADPTGSASDMVNNILLREANPHAADLPQPIAEFLAKLLAKDPAARFASAADALSALSAAIPDAVPAETSAIRESFLQAAKFVGRSHELNELSRALEQIVGAAPSLHRMERGTGDEVAFLIGGESGVGKSRLLDELRTLALVRGVTVLRGQSVREGGSVFGLWRPVLRYLIMSTDLTPTDAAVFKPLIPDIGDLLGVDVPEAAELAPQAARERLMNAIASLFQRQTQPMLLMLEDLHWTGESLDVLSRLLEQALPHLMIVGSYRDDERPDLPAKLPTMRLIKLPRLTGDDVRELSSAMLGDAGRQPEVVDLLTRETEGNVFFIVEVVRALAEEAGRLDQIGTLNLPQSIAVGGMQRIIERRIARVPEQARALLEIAAVTGRDLDLNVLLHLLPTPENMVDSPQERIDGWLAVCAETAVLEVHDERWRFAHEKLREGLLAALDATARRQRHEQVARGLQAVYGDSPDKAILQAYHWRAAGDHEREAHYTRIAGDAALLNGANAQAAGFYQRHLDALRALPPVAETQREIIDGSLRLARIGAYHALEGVVEMLEAAHQRAVEISDEARQAHVLSSLGTYYYTRGQLGKAFEYFSRCIPAAERLGLEEALLLPYNILGRAVQLSGDFKRAIELLERGVPLAQKFNDLDLLSGSLACLAVMFYNVGRIEEAGALVERVEAIWQQIRSSEREAGDRVILGIGCAMSGHLEIAYPHLTKAQELIGERPLVQPLTVMNGALGILYLRRNQLDLAETHLERSIALGQQHNIYVLHLLIQQARAEVDFRHGNLDAAQARAEKALAQVDALRQEIARGELHRLMGLIASARDEWDSADQHFTTALASHEAGNRQAFYHMTLFDHAASYALRGDTARAAELGTQALAAFERLHMTVNVADARPLLSEWTAQKDPT